MNAALLFLAVWSLGAAGIVLDKLNVLWDRPRACRP
jgi:hypothetical protein